MAKHLPYLLELAAAGGLMYVFAFASLTKMAIGAALTIAGAFFPHSSADKATGMGTMKVAGLNITLRGSLRVGVLLAGLLVLSNEGISIKKNFEKYRDTANSAASKIKDITDEEEAKKLSPFQIHGRNLAKLGELHDTLSSMQSAKPDIAIQASLSEVEKQIKIEKLWLDILRPSTSNSPPGSHQSREP